MTKPPRKLNGLAFGLTLQAPARMPSRYRQLGIARFPRQGGVENMLVTSLIAQGEFLASFRFSPEQLADVRDIGSLLHQGKAVGALKCGEIVGCPPNNVKDNDHDEWKAGGSRGSATDSRQRHTGTQTTPNPARPFGGDRRAYYQAQIANLREDYPATKCRGEEKGLWLAVPARPLGRSGPQVVFLCVVPDNPEAPVWCWAFWRNREHCAWIGPRHTNYPDGSVCAFPPNQGYWNDGDSLVSYFDRACEWCLRQLHLCLEGYWPGDQTGMGSYYQLKEGLAREKCFCRSGSEYFECCRDSDLRNLAAGSREAFLSMTRGVDVGRQAPPHQVIQFVIGKRKKFPKIAASHPSFASPARANPS